MNEKYSGIYQDMVEQLGEETTVQIFNVYKGQQITFPMRFYSQEYVITYLKENYNGKNIQELSRELGYTSNWLQKLIRKNIKNNK
ncbi:MAG: Mor transcription activator family protein [Culicoidibacterales bacterium]